jgi:two-component system, chemotaxis family, protein-glutamate methylesterase/glutaminase
VIVSANVDVREVAVSMNALKAGALALVPKPPGPSSPRYEDRCRELLATVKAMSKVKLLRRGEHRVREEPATVVRPPSQVATQLPQVIAIAGSTGAPSPLQKILASLPFDFPVPILVVQHIAVGFSNGFVHWLNGSSRVQVQLAGNGERLMPATAYICPDNKHLLVGASGVALLSDARMHGGFRPSATLLFESVAEVYGPASLCLILSGMGRDGVDGLGAVKRAGGRILAQSEATCVVYGMPKEAVEAGWVDEILAPYSMAERLVAAVRGSG